MSPAELLGKVFGALQTRRCLIRTKTVNTVFAELIHYATDQRALRSRDHQIYGVVAGKIQQGRSIICVNGHIVDPAFIIGPGVAGCYKDLLCTG